MPRSCALQQGKPLQREAHPPQQRAAPAHHNERKPAHGKDDPTQPKTEETYLKKKKKKDEWIKKLRLYTHKGILFSHKKNDILDKKDQKKRNAILLSDTTWTDLEGIMLRERNQRKTSTICSLLYAESKQIMKQKH